MGTALVVLVVLAVVGAVVVMTLRGRQGKELGAGGGGGGGGAPQLSPADEQRALTGDVRKLRPGDVINHDGNDFLIERTMVFDEDGFKWHEHLLDDPVSGRAMWLSVEDDDGLELAMYEKVSGAALEPGPDSLDHDGVSYRLNERGRARYTTETSQGPAESGDMEYADYVAGDRRLAFERYGTGGWEVSRGEVVSEHALDVYGR